MLELEIRALREEVKELRLLLASFARDMSFYRPESEPKPFVPEDDENYVHPESRPEVLAELNKPVEQYVEYVRNLAKSPEAAKPEAAKPEAAKPEAAKPEVAKPEAVTRDDVQAKCLAIVRADREKRDAVAAAIGLFNGAKVLRDVPDQDLPALMAELEKLT